MLGPVSAQTNLYQPVQDSRVPAESPSPERMSASVAAEPYSTSAATAIAGNLNMMLLSAPERMSQNLVVLTEVLSTVLKMKQEPGEQLTAFAARLIEAIATLPPAELQKLRVMLSDAFAGLQLRTLLQALRNPQGPEAATLAIYLELYRQKDRDPGARAVISSYRQNDETVLTQMVRDPRSATAQPQPSSPSPSRQTAPLSSPPASPSGTAPRDTVSGLPPAAGEDADMVYRPTPALNSAKTAGQTEGSNLQVLRQMRDRIAAAADPVPISVMDPPDLAVPQRAAAETDATAKADRLPSPSTPSMEKDSPTFLSQADSQDTESPPVSNTPPSTPRTPSLPAHLLEEVAETELIRTLLALYAADEAPDVVDAALDALMPREADEMEAKSPLPLAAAQADDEIDDLGAPSLQRPVHLEERLALARSTPVSGQQEVARTGVAIEGLPLAFVNYVIESEDEMDDASKARKHGQEDEQSGEAEDEAREPGEGASENPEEDDVEPSATTIEMADGEDRLDLGLAAPRLDAGELPLPLPSPDEDPAQALYLRLSDFA